jgi:hypothetical protein
MNYNFAQTNRVTAPSLFTQDTNTGRSDPYIQISKIYLQGLKLNWKRP